MSAFRTEWIERQRLELGRTYEYDDWLFVVVSERDERTLMVLCLTAYGWRCQPGDVVEVSYNSAVGQYAKLVA